MKNRVMYSAIIYTSVSMYYIAEVKSAVDLCSVVASTAMTSFYKYFTNIG